MALCLTRCCRIVQSAKFQFRKNFRNEGFHFRDNPLIGCAFPRSYQRIITKNLENIRLKGDYLGNRFFHSSGLLLKKFKESDYETLRVLDPSGQFLCNAEMLVIEKFCHLYHRFTFQEFKSESKDDSENAIGDGKLRVFQLVDKRKEKLEESKGTKTKMIKFHKDATADDKVLRVWEILVDKGKVNITFDKKDSRVERTVLKILQEFRNVKIVSSPDKTVLLVSLTDIDSELLHSLFEDVRKREADHIAKVKEMMKTIGGN